MLSDRFRRWWRRVIEKLAGKFYEGPEIPKRLFEETRLFRVFYPAASADEWEHHVRLLVAKAYEEGFIRGYEWQERGWPGPTDDPEVIAEQQAHNWSLADASPHWDAVMNGDADPNNPLAGYSPEQQRAFIEYLKVAQGSPYQVRPFVVKPPRDDELD